MKVIIFGAEGQLGKEFVKIFSLDANVELFKFDIKKLDISDFEAVANVIEKIEPELIINCAAFVDTVVAEQQFSPNYPVNTFAPYNLALLSNKIGAKFVHFSTDYVFDGLQSLPYTEADKCNPVNEYGRAKCIGEHIILEKYPQSLIFRLSWVYGLGEHNFIYKLVQWSRNQHVLRIVDDEISVPTSVKFITQHVLEALSADLSGLYHLTPKGFCSRYEWALMIKKHLDLDVEIQTAKIIDFEQKIKRPHFSAMSSAQLSGAIGAQFKSWNEVLDEYLLQEREYFKLPPT
jgi:dTDP-4-dehydrorhamnose reductase